MLHEVLCSVMNISHFDRESKRRDVRDMLWYWNKESRDEKFSEGPFAEAKKCGILCFTCHTKYDNFYKYGPPKHPKVSWDGKYRRSGAGPNGADWQQWKRSYLRLCKEWDQKLAR